MKGDEINLENAWALFEKDAIPEGAPRAQKDAMQGAFQAGCATILQIERATRGEPQPHVQRLFDRWYEEVEQAARKAAGIDADKPH